MSETLSSYRSSRGPKDRSDPAYNIGQVVFLEPIPRSYNTGGGSTIDKGQFVFVKAGTFLNFFEDSKGQNVVGPSGGKGGQSGNPSRSNGEYVGTTTGLADGAFIQVQWMNSWWQDPKLEKGSGFNPIALVNSIVGAVKGGAQKSEVKTSWVRVDLVDLKKEMTSGSSDTDIDTTPLPTGTTSGIDTTTLGYAAVVGAVVFGMRKKKKRR